MLFLNLSRFQADDSIRSEPKRKTSLDKRPVPQVQKDSREINFNKQNLIIYLFLIGLEVFI